MKKIRKLATADWIFIAITLGIFILVLFGKQIAHPIPHSNKYERKIPAIFFAASFRHGSFR